MDKIDWILGGLFVSYVVVTQYLDWRYKRTMNQRFEQLYEDEPFLSDEELPGFSESTGLIFKKLIPLSGKVIYENGELRISQKDHEATCIAMSDVENFEIEPFIAMKKGPISMMVRLKTKGKKLGVRFTIKELEPWRSLLSHAVEQQEKEAT